MSQIDAPSDPVVSAHTAAFEPRGLSTGKQHAPP